MTNFSDRERTLVEAARHALAVFRELGKSGAYPPQLLPSQPEYMGKQGLMFLLDALKPYEEMKETTTSIDVFQRIVADVFQDKTETKPVTIEAPKKVSKPKKPKIVPTSFGGTHRTGGLSDKFKVADITKVLGFKPQSHGDEKCKYEWAFTVDGVKCAIWDYKGSRWNTYGPAEKFALLFGKENVE